MFDLEASVSAWRRVFAADWADRADLDELEDHLREDFAAFVRSGCAPEEAWTLAQLRLGPPADIAREFGRSGGLSRLDRSVFAIVLCGTALAIVAVAMVMVSRVPHAVAGRVLAGHAVAITTGYAAGLAAAVLAAYVALKSLLVGRSSARLSTAAVRCVRVTNLVALTVTIVGFVLGAAWLNAAQGQLFDGDPRELGGLAVGVCLLGTLAISCRRGVSAAVVLALAIAAGGVVLAAWFGARPEHAGGRLLLQVIGFGGLAASLALAAIALKYSRDSTAPAVR